MLTVGAACSSPGDRPEADAIAGDDSATSAETDPSGGGQSGTTLLIDAAAPGTPIDSRLFGTNVPAWLGPERLQSEWFLDALAESGVTTLRLPGGSWSNGYDWLACELGDDGGCWWTWAARPSDFAELLAESGLDGIWTVSINESAQSAAALVAFFNGDVGDDTVIGPDREGVDWGTVGKWAELRAEGGHPDPVRIEMWEIGNEVYGGRPSVAGGEECAEWGWEDVWTCDGKEYMEGADYHDGYLAIREAMLTVDPVIKTGAVGVGDPSSWWDFGHEVFEHADQVDFYVVHDYGFDYSPSVTEALAEPAERWPGVVESAIPGEHGHIELALTEYNLVAWIEADTDRVMTRVVNAFYLADIIGRMATAGVDIANHWNFANGAADNGSDYGVVGADEGERYPAFMALMAWAQAGPELLSAPELDRVEGVVFYPTRHADGRLAVIALNPFEERSVPVEWRSLDEGAQVTVESAVAATLEASTMDWRAPDVLGAAAQVTSLTLPAHSISVVTVGGG